MLTSTIYIVSDSLGDTAETFAKAGLIQFSERHFNIVKKLFVDDLATIDEIIDEAVSQDALIVYTLIKPEIRAYMELRAKEEGLYTYDVFGSFLEVVERKYNTSALREPGLVRRLDEEYYKRIDAIEFSVKHDDGKDPKGLLKADIILVGISRTSKTPLSQFLAHKGFKVANMPLVPEVEPPEELFLADPRKCIGLKTSPEKLNSIRKERLKSLGLADTAIYANIDRIQEELKYFEKIIERLDCPVIDVTSKAIEETAQIVLDIIRKREIGLFS